jgi:hypothetical protein
MGAGGNASNSDTSDCEWDFLSGWFVCDVGETHASTIAMKRQVEK